jgi:hypothetical protein
MHISDFTKMSLTENGIWKKLLEKRENFLGDFNLTFGTGALSQLTGLKGKHVLQARIPYSWDTRLHQWVIRSQHCKAL